MSNQPALVDKVALVSGGSRGELLRALLLILLPPSWTPVSLKILPKKFFTID